MQLTDMVDQYYKQNFLDLTPDKQFHFASRLGAWNRDPFCLEVLEKRDDIARGGNLSLIRDDLQELLSNPPAAKINAAESRQIYFDKYPELRGRMLALFRVRHLLYHYEIDAREVFLELCPVDTLTSLSRTLLTDHDALKILSTYAINYIYLVHHILFTDTVEPTDIARLALELGQTYDTTSPEQIQLLIYLYTHCIIGESNFYFRSISQDRDLFNVMLSEIESVINTSHELINLDNKLEFLVCCRIMGYQTNLFDTIYRECQKSISPEGVFVIDTINLYKQSSKTSFSDSEHRNVLFIMSASDYPHA